MESFNGFVTVLDGFTTVHKASFGRIIMTDLGRRRRTPGLERVERVCAGAGNWVLGLGGQITAHQEDM